MRRSFLTLGFSVGLLALGACSTFGQPVTFNLAELTTRCESRGGNLQPTGNQTGRAQADYVCRDAMVRAVPRVQARTQLDQAITRSLKGGY